MAVVPRKRKGKVVYGVLTSWPGGKPHWELVGPNKREAESLDKQRRREVKAGTFKPGELTGASTVAAYAAKWLAGRKNAAAKADRSTMRDHVLSVKWFATLPMTDVRPKHILQLIGELKEKTNPVMAPKSITNLMGVLRVMFRDAVIAEVISATPYVVPKGTLSRRGAKRTPYTVDELEALVSDVVGERQQVWNALAFFLGARLGEVCGLRWSDWDEAPRPLGAMTVARQYEGRATKTGRGRTVPVHPRLAAILTAWRARWSLHFLRRPGPDDFIVPQAAGRHIERQVAYKHWRAGCLAAEVTNKTVHSTRHTFITLTQRGGADRRIVERITHNPKDEIIDVYTTRDWSEFCAVVMCLPAGNPTADSARASKPAPDSGSSGQNEPSGGSSGSPGLQDSRELPQGDMVRVLELEPDSLGESRRASNGPSKTLTHGWWGPSDPPAVAAEFPGLRDDALRPPSKARPVGYVARRRRAAFDRAFGAVVAGPRRSR